MKKYLLFLTCGLFLLQNNKVQAQVDDVSLIIAPKGGYNWFDTKSTVENGFMYGLQGGFSFGKIMELRASFEQTANLQQAFGKYQGDIRDLLNDNQFRFPNREVRVRRLGGELRANLYTGKVAPYIGIGTGVQTFRVKEANGVYKNENLYGLGLVGLKIQLSPRVTFNLQGEGIVYNMNPGSLLYDPNAGSVFDDWIESQKKTQMFNWAASASLQFYLGGTNTENLTPLERAYMKKFSGGYEGVKVSLSPMIGLMDFNKESFYRNNYGLGGKIGVDFSNFIGLEGYYLQSTNGKNVSFDFDKLSMVGVDFVGKLNVPRGIVPYLTVGAGYIYVQDGYEGRTLQSPTNLPISTPHLESSYFAKGGLGLEVPLGSVISAFGSASLIYTIGNGSNDVNDIANIRSAGQLQQHQLYSAGLKFNIGKKVNTRQAQARAFDNRFDSERKAYNRQIKQLENELVEAYNANDTLRMAQIMAEKKAAEYKEAQRVEAQKTQNQDDQLWIDEGEAPKDDLIRMTPAELQKMIDQTLQKVTEEDDSIKLDKRLDRMEMLLRDLKNNQSSVNTPVTPGMANSHPLDPAYYSQVTEANSEALKTAKETNEKLAAEIERLNKRLQEQSLDIDRHETRGSQANEQQGQTIYVPSPDPTVRVVPMETQDPTMNGTDYYGQVDPAYYPQSWNTMALYVGPSFGATTNFNIGLRGYLGFPRTRIKFMPEVYAAMGNGGGFGATVNGIIPVNIKSEPRLKPYGGVGVGVHYLNSDFSFLTNVVLGAGYHVGQRGAQVFADYSIRGAFKYNQIALGYRFGI